MMQSNQVTSFLLILLTLNFVISDAFVPNHQRNNVATRLYEKKKYTKKTTDRAYNERNFEAMMGNDWREFRAKLVAQEKAAMTLRETTAYYHGSQLMANNGRIGELFAGSINIFDDRIVGVLDCNDPFVSKDELPIIMQKSINVDKHRWAHPIPRPEKGSILISNERFCQTVVLMISHCDKSGSSGVVINRLLDEESHKKALDCLKDEFADSPTAYGGPMMQEEFSIVHSFGEVEGSMKLCNGVYIGGYEELVDEVRRQRCDPKKCLFVKGHASWGPGQLSDEIAQGVWHPAAASSDLILRYAGGKVAASDNYDDLWADLMRIVNNEENNYSNNGHFVTRDHGRSDARVYYSE